MRVRELVRDLILITAAAAIGWWCHGTQVHAQRSSGDFDGRLTFQFAPESPLSALSIYSPADHTVYVYPRVASGNSHVGCDYMFHISRPGAPIDRENCKVGNALP